MSDRDSRCGINITWAWRFSALFACRLHVAGFTVGVRTFSAFTAIAVAAAARTCFTLGSGPTAGAIARLARGVTLNPRCTVAVRHIPRLTGQASAITAWLACAGIHRLTFTVCRFTAPLVATSIALATFAPAFTIAGLTTRLACVGADFADRVGFSRRPILARLGSLAAHGRRHGCLVRKCYVLLCCVAR